MVYCDTSGYSSDLSSQYQKKSDGNESVEDKGGSQSNSKLDDIIDTMRQGEKSLNGRRIVYQSDEKTRIIFGLDLN